LLSFFNISNKYEESKNVTLKLQAKAYKAKASQMRIVAAYFENKLKDYNRQVAVITALVTDQEEELFIN